MNDDSSGDERAETTAAPPIAYMGGAARRVSAALLGAPSQGQKPPTDNAAEGAGKKEEAGAMHKGEAKGRVRPVKWDRG